MGSGDFRVPLLWWDLCSILGDQSQPKPSSVWYENAWAALDSINKLVRKKESIVIDERKRPIASFTGGEPEPYSEIPQAADGAEIQGGCRVPEKQNHFQRVSRTVSSEILLVNYGLRPRKVCEKAWVFCSGFRKTPKIFLLTKPVHGTWKENMQLTVNSQLLEINLDNKDLQRWITAYPLLVSCLLCLGLNVKNIIRPLNLSSVIQLFLLSS